MMISPETLDFLRKLKHNNNREWFEANKDYYLKAKKNFDDFVIRLIQIVKSVDPEIGIIEPKNCIFRIYRDTRFSKDKSPYKTNFGAYINRGGKNSRWAGYYFHIEPGEIFVSGGIYMPEADILKAVREAIADEPDTFLGIINDPEFKKYFPELAGEKLKTIPKAYPRNHPHIELLRYTSYIVYRSLKESELYSSEITDKIRDIFAQLKKFNDFLNNVIKHYV